MDMRHLVTGFSEQSYRGLSHCHRKWTDALRVPALLYSCPENWVQTFPPAQPFALWQSCLRMGSFHVNLSFITVTRDLWPLEKPTSLPACGPAFLPPFLSFSLAFCMCLWYVCLCIWGMFICVWQRVCVHMCARAHTQARVSSCITFCLLCWSQGAYLFL